ncbi:MAG TPA: AI-2E family transporter [Candidatus Ornithocaccomicrobium faecavium]|uniref:AI-2E family transporter n=1 Tax=Candidatus Ornithocaccomicrobium faecavium TaxID=2840890 RepID=A0A9D1P9X4_9FIRM|nr:AI-2E family transporter [Candidatus Ornithocaccomicrobium faecavium]
MKPICTRTLVKIALAAFALFLAIYYWPAMARFLGLLLSACLPLLLGLCFAYLINILMSFYERHFFPASQRRAILKMRPGLCLTLAILTLLGICAFIVGMAVPQLAACFRLLIAEIPAGVEQLLGWLASHDVLTPERMAEIEASLAGLNWQAWLESIAPTVMTGFLGAIGSVVSGTTTVFIALIFAIFTLLGKRRLFAQCARLLERYLSERRRGQVRYVSGILNECFHRFIVGQCTEAVLLGALCALGMLLFGMPHALMIGALTAFTALVPIVGAFIGGAIGAFLLLMESPAQALLFLVFIVVLQQLEGNLIYPHVVGSSLQLPSMWVLAAVTVGGGVLGILGTFLGVPLAASGYRLLKNDVNKRSPWYSSSSAGALSEPEEKQ